MASERLKTASLKSRVKSALGWLPPGAKRRLLNFYHWLQALAANLRYRFPARSMRVVMITGTNGKTTTASYLLSVLKQAGFKTGAITTAYFETDGDRTVNDFNATVVHPMVLQRMLRKMRLKGVEFVVMEATSHALDQHRLWGIPAEMAVMTNLTQDHLDYHGDMENYAAAKARLFKRRPRFVVLNHDDGWFDYFNQFGAGEQKITYGTDPDAECRILSADLKKQGSRVKLEIDHQTRLTLNTALPGKFNVYNAVAAAAAAYLLHVDLSHIEQGIARLEGVPGRMEETAPGMPFSVLVDYAHTPDALKNLLETLKHLTKGRVILVFGACGDRDKAKRPEMGRIAAQLADRVFVTDEESYSEDPQAIRDMLVHGIKQEGGEAKTEEIADRRAAIEKAISIARPGDTVAVTGMGHERFRIINGERLPWNDAEVIRDILSNRTPAPDA